MARLYAGVDWAEGHHDYAVVDERGKLIVHGRVPESRAGHRQLVKFLNKCAADSDEPITVAIETDRGLVPSMLQEHGYALCAINPLKFAAYRTRRRVTKTKSDYEDARLLANILRTDPDEHPPMPAQSEESQALRVLARAHQDAAWRVSRAANELRSLLREYYPSALLAFPPKRLRQPIVITVLHAIPSPRAAAGATVEDVVDALREGGAKRGFDKRADAILTKLQAPSSRRGEVVEAALAMQCQSLLATLGQALKTEAELEGLVEQQLRKVPQHSLLESIPGCGTVLGARMLGEIGDDPTRFPKASNLRAYAGTAPGTRQSGKSSVVGFRHIRNRRLATAAYLWAFMSITLSELARAHYDARRAKGDRNAAALRHLANKLLGGLHHCLRTGEPWDERAIFRTPEVDADVPAASSHVA